MPWSINEAKICRFNKAGAKIAAYSDLALVVHIETFKVDKYGEYEEMKDYIDKKYYEHPQHHLKSFKHMIYHSDSWLPKAIEKIVDKGDIKFTKNLDYPDNDHLFVEKGGHVGMCYSRFVCSGAPPLSYWKEMDRKNASRMELSEEESEENKAAEVRRQRSLKAAETMRKNRLVPNKK